MATIGVVQGIGDRDFPSYNNLFPQSLYNNLRLV